MQRPCRPRDNWGFGLWLGWAVTIKVKDKSPRKRFGEGKAMKVFKAASCNISGTAELGWSLRNFVITWTFIFFRDEGE